MNQYSHIRISLTKKKKLFCPFWKNTNFVCHCITTTKMIMSRTLYYKEHNSHQLFPCSFSHPLVNFFLSPIFKNKYYINFFVTNFNIKRKIVIFLIYILSTLITYFPSKTYIKWNLSKLILRGIVNIYYFVDALWRINIY